MGEMHRYIPVLAKWAAFYPNNRKDRMNNVQKIWKSKFGWRRFVNGYLDLLSSLLLEKFAKRHMHFFGLWEVSFFIAGIALYLLFQKFLNPIDFALTIPEMSILA